MTSKRSGIKTNSDPILDLNPGREATAERCQAFSRHSTQGLVVRDKV